MAAFQTLLGLGTGRAPTPYQRIRAAQDVKIRLGWSQHVGVSWNNRISTRNVTRWHLGAVNPLPGPIRGTFAGYCAWASWAHRRITPARID